MNWKKVLFYSFAVIGIIALTVVASAYMLPQIKTSNEKQILTEVPKTLITDKFVVVTDVMNYVEKDIETYVMTSTKGSDGKKYVQMHMLSSIKQEEDVLKSDQKGIEASLVIKITQNLLDRKPRRFEGMIEAQTGTIEYYIKEYNDQFCSFCISRNNIDIIKYIGEKKTTWEIIKKIHGSLLQKQQSYQNSKQPYVEATQINAYSGIADVQKKNFAGSIPISSAGKMLIA